jgi:dipeptidyl aminopeptidase/acylaminoacyl peptidase
VRRGVPAATPGRIAYVGPDGNIWATNPDGTDKHALTSDGGSNSPAWSANGAKIAFLSRTAIDPMRTCSLLEVMNSDGSGRQVAMEAIPGCARESNVRWSADGCTLYVAMELGPEQPVQSQPLCGGTPATTGTARFFDVRADGTFVESWSSPQQGFPFGLGALGAESVSTVIDVAGPVAWSPDGGRIAMQGGDRGDQIRILNGSGVLISATSVPGRDDKRHWGLSAIDWSPDGTQVAYEEADGIHLLTIATGQTSFLTAGSQPQWTP